MPLSGLSAEEAAGTLDTVFTKLHSSESGLSSIDANQRLQQLGPNALPEKHQSPWVEFGRFYWGPIPWMIEVADVLSGILRHWDDFVVISTLLVFNAVVGFWQEHTAADAVAALKAQLALRCLVLRDGTWSAMDAAALVPGDVVRISLGGIVPADVKIFGDGYLRIDQSALTGESLPVDKSAGDTAYSGSVAVKGEMTAVVTATGSQTYFGRTTHLVADAHPTSHFQAAILAIGDYLIYLTLVLVAALVIVELFRGVKVLTLIQYGLILTVAAIPVAMPAVLSVTMAVGAFSLSKQKAIVTRLESIEELAGVDVLCTDKTGTLTSNQLAVGEPVLFSGASSDEVILDAALASRTDSQDAIDTAVVNALSDRTLLARYTVSSFVPFDPVSKRSEASVADANGVTSTLTKGAPQVIFDLCALSVDDRKRADATVDDLANRGFRTLGVARKSGAEGWSLRGVLSLSDPPRPDSAETIKRAMQLGISVKMLTGDNTAIAAEVATEVGLGKQIEPASAVLGDMTDDEVSDAVAHRIEQIDGFAEVFPEHKYAIVKALQARGHIVGMTGDGVNDAPALRQADTGIAVSGATDAARAAAAVVLTAPGLSVIVSAIEQARVIFERMNSYAIYRVSETIRIIIFVVLAMIAFNFYPITAILIIMLAFFNDLPIMMIAWDNTAIDAQPVRWQMRRVLTLSTVLGTIGVIDTFGLLVLAQDWMHLDIAEIETLIFLKLAVAGHLTIFIARSRESMFKRPWPAPRLIGALAVTVVLATLLAAFGLGFVTTITWGQIAFVWAYSASWALVVDQAKLATYRHLDNRAGHHQKFFHILQEDLRQWHTTESSRSATNAWGRDGAMTQIPNTSRVRDDSTTTP